MTTNNLFINWLAENLKRLFTKSPKFFLVWTWVSGLLVAITGIPEALDFFGVILPPALEVLANKAVAMASGGAFFMSLLTTQSTPVALTNDGEMLKKTDENKLPFTSRCEKKQVIKSNVTDSLPKI